MAKLSTEISDRIQASNLFIQHRVDSIHMEQGLVMNLAQKITCKVWDKVSGEVPAHDDTTWDDLCVIAVTTLAEVLAHVLTIAQPLHKSCGHIKGSCQQKEITKQQPTAWSNKVTTARKKQCGTLAPTTSWNIIILSIQDFPHFLCWYIWYTIYTHTS